MPVYPPKSSGAPSYAPANLKNTYDPISCVYNWKASNTRILQQGLANAKAGGNTTHLVMGDSTSDGGYAGQPAPSYDRLRAWPVAMRDTLALMGIPETGNGGVKVCDGGILDTRFVLGGVWTLTSNYFATTSAVAATATFTAERSASVVEVWYYDGFTATFTISVGGATSGAGFTTVTGGGTAAWLKRRLTGVSVAVGTTVVITCTVAGTGLVLAGVKTFTPGGGFILDNLAQSASTATGTGGSSWLDTTINSGLGGAYQNLSGRTRQVTDGVTTSASATFGSATAAFTLQDVGEPIDFPPPTSGAGAPFPANTYIAAFISATQVTMSTPAVVTATAVTANISRDPACIHIALGINDVATQSAATITAAITTIRNRFPKSDCILHLQHEQNYAVVPQATQQLLQAAMYSLADTLDVPLCDWRDRIGPVATGWANGAYGDYALHLTAASNMTFGSMLARLMIGGAAHPQANTTPVYDTDLTQKSYVDARTVAQQSGWRNLLHNGAMEVMQRGAGSSVSASTANHFLIDRWQCYVNAGGPGSITTNYDGTTPPAGFSISLKVTVGTADAALGTTKQYAILQQVEGLNVQSLMWGSALGRSVTLSFWAKSSLTGTFGGAVRGTQNNIGYPFSYSLPVANTWTFITITIPPTTLAVFTALDITGQLSVVFSLGMGTNSQGTLNTWTNGTPAGAFPPLAPPSTVAVISTAGATFAVTGVQLEQGTVATPFERRPFGAELALCQRYFYLVGRSTVTNAVLSNGGQEITTTTGAFQIKTPVSLRTIPTILTSLASQPFATSTIGINASNRAANGVVSALSLGAGTTPEMADISATFAAVGAVGQSLALLGNAAQAYIGLTAEI